MSLSINNGKSNFYPTVVMQTNWHCDYLFSCHGGCRHDCIYCSSKRWYRYKQKDPITQKPYDPTIERRLITEWNGDNLRRKLLPMGGIFIAPYNDIMTVPEDDRIKILELCMKSYNYHTCNGDYFNCIFQTKNPAEYFDYLDMIPPGSWLGTTIEETATVTEYYKMTKAPSTDSRHLAMQRLNTYPHFRRFVTIEPIMKFDIRYMVSWMRDMKPDLVFIGADTGKHNLPDPTGEEVKDLIFELRDFTIVECKKNLERIVGKAWMDGEKLAIQQMKEKG